MPSPVSCHLFVHISVLRRLRALESFLLSSAVQTPQLRLLTFQPRGTYPNFIRFLQQGATVGGARRSPTTHSTKADPSNSLHIDLTPIDLAYTWDRVAEPRLTTQHHLIDGAKFGICRKEYIDHATRHQHQYLHTFAILPQDVAAAAAAAAVNHLLSLANAATTLTL